MEKLVKRRGLDKSIYSHLFTSKKLAGKYFSKVKP